jgi:hypothetical protein
MGSGDRDGPAEYPSPGNDVVRTFGPRHHRPNSRDQQVPHCAEAVRDRVERRGVRPLLERDDYGDMGSQPTPSPSASSPLGSGGRTVKLRSSVIAHG